MTMKMFTISVQVFISYRAYGYGQLQGGRMRYASWVYSIVKATQARNVPVMPRLVAIFELLRRGTATAIVPVQEVIRFGP
jgi:hypothetical protein